MTAPVRRLVVIVGPIAAGKSTVAQALATAMRARGEVVALVGLDEVAEMALPTLPSWHWAGQVHARTVRAWLDTPVTAVVAEGPGTPRELDVFLAAVPATVAPEVVLVHSDYGTALQRAQADPTRGASREPGFLHQTYARFDVERAVLHHDLAVDTSATTVAQAVSAILAHLSR